MGGERSVAGGVGLWATVGVGIVLGIHPLGTTALYDDGGGYLEHVGGFWIALHLVATVLLLAYPLVLGVWARGLSTPVARLVGRWASTVALVGMAVGTVHLVATDTLVFHFFADTWAAGGGSPEVTTAADLLLRLHASTLSAWVVAFWLPVPALVAVAHRLDGRGRTWLPVVAAAAALVQVPALAVTIGEGQWTFLSETVLFRTGATLLLLVVGVISWELRSSTSEVVADATTGS